MSPFKANKRFTTITGGNPMKALWDSIVRTVVPIATGAVIAWAVAHNIPLDPEFEFALSAAIVGGFQAVYYVAVRLFETYVSPKFGVLLGLAKQPAYAPKIVPGVSLRNDFN